MIPVSALQQWGVADPESARALIRAVLDWAAAAAVAVPAPPPEPDQCCGTGCIECVWEGYYPEVAWWRDDALRLGGVD